MQFLNENPKCVLRLMKKNITNEPKSMIKCRRFIFTSAIKKVWNLHSHKTSSATPFPPKKNHYKNTYEIFIFFQFLIYKYNSCASRYIVAPKRMKWNENSTMEKSEQFKDVDNTNSHEWKEMFIFSITLLIYFFYFILFHSLRPKHRTHIHIYLCQLI